MIQVRSARSPARTAPAARSPSRPALWQAASHNPKVIQARLGRATASEAMDTCGHLLQDSEDLGSRVVDEAWRELWRNADGPERYLVQANE